MTLLVLQKKVKSRTDEVNTVEVIILAIYWYFKTQLAGIKQF